MLNVLIDASLAVKRSSLLLMFGVVGVAEPDAALDALLDVALVAAEDANDQLQRQILPALRRRVRASTR